MDLGLKGKKALVTGGTRGIGRAVAEMFVRERADVSICARRAPEIDATVNALLAKGGRATGTTLDVADGAALRKWIDDTARAFGGIDILVCNASALAGGDTPESWRKAFAVDMMHTVNAVAAARPWLERSDAASIVIISSVSGIEVDFVAGSYGATKAALIHYAKGLSHQLAGKNIRVNAVSPGHTYVVGGTWHRIERQQPNLFRHALGLNPTGRMGTAEEVAYGVVFLASPIASRISGANLVIDGALSKAV